MRVSTSAFRPAPWPGQPLAVGTAEQIERFLTRFTEGEPKWGAMAITEPRPARTPQHPDDGHAG